MIHLRIERLGYLEATRVITTVAQAIEDDLARGCIASVTLSGVRVRRLPVT